MEDFRAPLLRQLREADLATGEAAQGFLPGFLRRLRHHEQRLAAARNPLTRRYHRWRREHWRRLVEEAREHIEAARLIRAGGLEPRR